VRRRPDGGTGETNGEKERRRAAERASEKKVPRGPQKDKVITRSAGKRVIHTRARELGPSAFLSISPLPISILLTLVAARSPPSPYEIWPIFNKNSRPHGNAS
jgi:hypothetical protein